MIIQTCEQGSVEWMLARAGIPTASEFDQLVTPDFAIRKGEMPRSYLAKKLAERWLGGPLPSFNSIDMDQGRILEEEAIPWYELEFDQPIERVGFITTNDGTAGCSPDGLLRTVAGRERGIEIKCPQVHTHVGYLLAGTLPKDYAAQVHGSMFVTGHQMWEFLSYRRNLPPLRIIVERDEEIISAIAEAVEAFTATLTGAFVKLCEMNGGPPKRHKHPTLAPETHDEKAYADIIP